MDAGRLDRRLSFESPTEITDDYGNTTSGWQGQYECAANIKYLRGGEQVLAARLAQTSPVIVTVRNCAAARAIGGTWRCRDTRTGALYQVKETPREADNRGHLEFLATAGVAA